jgi:Holliday junction resolvase-like predicted endonuclease
VQKSDYKIQRAKTAVMELFEDKIGRAKKKPYYLTQIQTLLEEEFTDKVIYQASTQLIKEKKLSRINIKTKNAGKVTFLYNAKFDRPIDFYKRNLHIKSMCKLIERYSNSETTLRYGQHLEDLVETELKRQGFNIVERHKNKYKGNRYDKSGENLDFIAEHQSGKLTIGVEVKNTLSLIDKKEVTTKIEICDHLGITPVFAARWLEQHKKLVHSKGGYTWTFKQQLYPPDSDALAKTLSKRLLLPIEAKKELPPQSIQLFHNWVKNQTT